MAIHKIKKGLDLPIAGEPQQAVDTARPPARVALLAADYHGLRPTMAVAEGDRVRRGQLLFEDKKTPGVRYTAPGAGKVAAIHRGERRAFVSLVIQLDSIADRGGRGDGVRFATETGKHPAQLSRDHVRDLLLESGLWTALRTRPFSQVADPQDKPHSIFVNAADTDPLAPKVSVVLAGNEEHFERGVTAVSKLTDGTTYLCTSPEVKLPVPAQGRCQVEVFDGPHPSGTVGFHIHTLDPVNRAKTVWYLDYQDAIAIGKLFATGELDVERVISIAGPAVKRPRLVRTRLGASIDDLLAGGEVQDGETRRISGSVLSGRKAQGEVDGYLGRYHRQVSVLCEDRDRELLGWLAPGTDKFSILGTFASRLMPGKKFALTTSTQGSDRAILPMGMYERVFPFDILPTFLLRALAVRDLERAEQLGALELDEEDLALCSFVCPGKHEYGPYLRDLLNVIQKEG